MLRAAGVPVLQGEPDPSGLFQVLEVALRGGAAEPRPLGDLVRRQRGPGLLSTRRMSSAVGAEWPLGSAAGEAEALRSAPKIRSTCSWPASPSPPDAMPSTVRRKAAYPSSLAPRSAKPNGLTRYCSAPSRIAACTVATSRAAVTMITSAQWPSWRIRRTRVRPGSSGR